MKNSRLFDLLYVILLVSAVSSWIAGQRAGVFKEVARTARFRFAESPQTLLDQIDDVDDRASEEDATQHDSGDDESDAADAEAELEARQARQNQRDLDRAAFVAAQREEIALNARLDEMRATQQSASDGGTVDVAAVAAAKMQHEGALEDFEGQLAGLIDLWSESWEASADAADNEAEAAVAADEDENSWRRILQQRAWERSELDRMLDDVRSRVKPPPPPPTLGLLLSASDVDRIPSGDASADRREMSHEASTPLSKEGGGNAGNNNAGAPASSASSSSDFGVVLRSIERRITRPKGRRDVVVLGDKVYVGRDIAVYRWAFTKAGFVLRERPESGKITTKRMMEGDWAVVLCLALSTDHCFASSAIAKTQRHQRINRLQGLRAVLWSKDSFCRTVSEAGLRGDERFENATFPCWQLPKEYPAVLAHAQSHGKTSYIVKPLTMGGGMGISVVDGEKGLHKVRHKTLMVQTYLANPHLIHGRKWDVRTYVLVTSVYPMRAYLYTRGLVRFATKAYDPNAKKGGKRAQFLTNTSVNKHYSKKGNVTDITWSFDSLRAYCNERGVSFENLLAAMERAISLVLLSAEQAWLRYFEDRRYATEHYCSNCYQVMGVDLIVDSTLHPRVIEVNGQPSMKLTKEAGDHYTKTKSSMVRDMVALVFNDADAATHLEASVDGIDGLDGLDRRSWEFLLDTAREGAALGGWRRVYPSARNAAVHRSFLEKQRSVGSQRLLVHDVAVALDKKRGI